MRRVATLLLCTLGLTSASAGAQATLRGTVWDSLLVSAPLEGATVVLHGTTRTATTDRRGRFEFRDLDAGRYAVGFFHPALDSLDIAAPARAVELGATEIAEVTLATPSANGLSLLLCGRRADASTSLIFGTVRAAEDDAPLAGAEVLVRWFEVEIAARRARQVERIARDSARADGRYLLCGVPNDIALTLVAQHGRQLTGPLHLELDQRGVARRELRVSLLDPAARRLPDLAPDDTTPVGRVPGTAQLTVRVRNASGQPVERAIVGVRGTTIAGVTDAQGRVVLRELPAGTQTVVVRAIGLAPANPWVALAPQQERALEVTLTRFAHALPAVAVVGRRDDALAADIQRRTRASGGRLIEGEALQDLIASPTAWARIPGVSVGARSDADALPLMRGALGARCEPVIWSDGVRMSAMNGWELRGLMLNARRVEVYADGRRVPPEFSSGGMDPCGVIAIWSR
jgi:hypothetical protein